MPAQSAVGRWNALSISQSGIQNRISRIGLNIGTSVDHAGIYSITRSPRDSRARPRLKKLTGNSISKYLSRCKMIAIERCRLSHIRAIIPRLREEERIELDAIGEKARHVLIGLWRETAEPFAAVAGDEVAAVFGDVSPPLAAEGSVWLFTSAAIDRHPITLAKVARAEVARMLQVRHVLRSSMHKSCHRALKFYSMLGFDTVEGTMRENFVEIRISR